MTDSKIARQMRRKRRRKWNGVRFVSIDHPVLDCAPFTALSGAAAKAMLLLLRRWNGLENNNNGRLPLSVRDVKTYCHVGTDKALAVQRELAASKLAVPTQPGGFNFKMRHATEWRVSFLPTATAPATWEFAKAPPENSKHASYSRNRAVPTAGTLVR